MKIKKTITTEQVVKIICDGCKKEMNYGDDNGRIIWDGYNSGGEWKEKDLCRLCYDYLIGKLDWISR